MRLLIYSHFFSPSVGGVEIVVRSLASGLSGLDSQNGSKQFDLTVVTNTKAPAVSDAGLPFRLVRQPTVLQLWRLIRWSDVVHVAGPAVVPLFFAWLARKPTVIEHHGFQTICPNGQLLIEPPGAPCPGHYMAGRHKDCLRCNSAQGWSTSLRLWLQTFIRRFFSRRASVNITPTAWLGDLLQLPRTTAIPHGIAASGFQDRSVCSGPPVIAFQGRLVTTKGAKLLLDAAKILRDQNRAFELLMIGDGPERAHLEETAHQNRLANCVHFLGYLPVDQLEAALNRASIFVVPSLGGEVFGLVVLENMARSIALVVSDLGAFVEVIGDAGLTFRTGDAADLACTIAKLLDSPALAARLSQRARQRAVESYNAKRMIEAHAHVYVALARRSVF